MDDSNVQKVAEELTTCVICTNRYFEEDEEGVIRIPKVLDCAHTFCDKCITRHLQQCNANRISPVSNFPCPTCRKVIYLPLKGVGAFPTDLKIKQIMELLQNITETNTGAAPSRAAKNFCQTCRSKGSQVEGNFLCLTCQKIFCNGCRKLHQKLSLFSNHAFFNLDEQGRRGSKSSVDSSNECPLHSTDFEYKCITCNKSLCCICAMMPEHQRHKMAPLVSAGSKESENIYEDIEEMTNDDDRESTDEQLLKKKSFVATLKQRMDGVLSETNLCDDGGVFKTCEENINRAYKEAQKQLKSQHDELIKKLKDSKRSYDAIVSKKNEIQSAIKAAEKLLSDEKELKKGDAEKYEKLLPKLEAFDETSMAEAEQYRCSFKADVVVRLGELASESRDTVPPPPMTPRTRAPLPKQDAGKRASIVSQTEEASAKSDKTNDSFVVKKDAIFKALKSWQYKRQTIKTNGKSKSTADPPPPRPAAAAAAAPPSRYAVSNDMYQAMLHWHADGLRGLRNVCFVENGEVLLALKASLGPAEKQLIGHRSSDCSLLEVVVDDQVEPLDRIVNLCHCTDTKHLLLLGYRNDQGMIKKFKVTFSKKGMTCKLQCLETTKLASIKDPVALAANKKIVAILESGGSKVTAFNAKFEKISEIAEGEFNKTSYVTVDRNDRILLPDHGRREVKVFHKNELVLKFSSTGPKGEELLPHGMVCLTKQNNILVADQALDSVSLYNSEGNLLEVIVEKVKKPTGISYSEGKHLLAVATDKGLSVFKL